MLVNNLIHIMGTNEMSMIHDDPDKNGGRSYSLQVPKNLDVYVIINKKYVTKLNSGAKSNDIYLYDGPKDESVKYLAEWNKNKEANEAFFGNLYKERFNSKAMYEDNSEITISEPVGQPIAKPGKINAKKDLFDFIDSGLDRIPQYPGGARKFDEYVVKNLKYPPVAKEYNVQGKIYVSFVVEKDGSLTDLNLPRKLGSGCDEEAIRLVKDSGKWEPATYGGTPVRCKFNTFIRFSLF